MARKSTRKAASGERKPDAVQDVLAIRIAVEPTDGTPSYYANYAEVAHGPHEFAISFVKVPTKLSTVQIEEGKRGPLKLEPLVQVVFAPTMASGLIKALSTVKERYEQQYGPIKDEQGGRNK